MKQTIIGSNTELFMKKLNKYKIICIAVAAVTVLINIFLTLLRTDANHSTMLILNIAVSVLGCWALMIIFNVLLSPMLKLQKLYKQDKSYVCGKVLNISAETECVESLDCRKVTIDENNAPRILFVPDTDEIHIGEGESFHFGIVSGIVVEVCDEK